MKNDDVRLIFSTAKLNIKDYTKIFIEASVFSFATRKAGRLNLEFHH